MWRAGGKFWRKHIANAPRQYRNRSAGMRKNKTDIRKLRECAIDEQTGDAAHGVEVIFDPRSGNAREKVLAAAWRSRVNEYNGLAAIEVLEHGRKNSIARPFIAVIRHHRDAI